MKGVLMMLGGCQELFLKVSEIFWLLGIRWAKEGFLESVQNYVNRIFRTKRFWTQFLF